MKALFFDLDGPLDSQLIDPSSIDNVGDGIVAIKKKLFKPKREFGLKSWDTLLKDQMEIIRNAVHSYRITAVFYFDGDFYGEITEPIYIADGNNSQLEFPMPFDNVFASSWIIYVNGTIVTNWTMMEEEGVLVFDSAPTGRITGKGKRKFRVIFKPDQTTLLNESQIYRNTSGDAVYSAQPIVLTEVGAVNIS